MVTCRTCLADCEADASKNLYTELPENPDHIVCIAEILTEVTHIQPKEDDNFSQIICTDCYGELCNAQSFIRKAHSSDRMMRDVSHLVSKDDILTDNDPNQQQVFNSDKEGNTASTDEPSQECLKNIENVSTDVNLEISNVTSLNESHRGLGSCQFDESHQPIALQSDESFEQNGCADSTAVDADVHVKEEIPDDFEIKQEPYSDDGVSMDYLNYYADGNEIKTEPSAQDEDPLEPSGRDENMSPHLNTSACPYLNGHGDSEDIKPTEDELKAYVSKANTIKISNEETSELTCEQCGAVLASKYAKYRHMKLHKAVLTHCILCSEVFKTRKTLKKHVIKAHSYGELPACEVCNTTFNSFDELTTHRSVHLPVRPDLKCIVCSQADFSSPKQLKVHLYSHREVPIVRDLICRACNKIFLNKFTLKTHRKNNCAARNKLERLNASKVNDRRMTDVKPTIKTEKREAFEEDKKGKLRCVLCPRTFMYEYARTLHMEQHQIRKFSCPVCKYKFKRKEHLSRHMLDNHGDEDDEDYA